MKRLINCERAKPSTAGAKPFSSIGAKHYSAKGAVLPLEDERELSLSALADDNPYRYTESEMDMQVLLSHLNAQQREAIELRYVHDLPYQTIADITGAPLGTIKSRISQGIQKLKVMIGGDRYEHDRREITGA
ncbi:hypothetical protein HMSSN036_48670 [Paenibacillus macerans]|nr:hypothetical protein HMSSN036_48670 [Paenibacillus macerans]